MKSRPYMKSIDQMIDWIERRLFHDDEYQPPSESDLHIWLRQAKKIKREQSNLRSRAQKAAGYKGWALKLKRELEGIEANARGAS